MERNPSLTCKIYERWAKRFLFGPLDRLPTFTSHESDDFSARVLDGVALDLIAGPNHQFVLLGEPWTYYRIGSELLRLLDHLFEQLVFGAEQTAVPNHLSYKRILVGDFGSGGLNRYVLSLRIGRGLS